ncbi:MAG: LPXTG cell wall anchor domain-containing protein [Labedaea sp.]
MARTSAFAKRALVAAVAAGAAMVALAIPASAHTPTISADCDAAGNVTWLKVKLKDYQPDPDPKHDPVLENTVEITDGATVLVPKTVFVDNFYMDWTAAGKNGFDATVEHKFKVVVKAWDDTNPRDWKHFSFTWEQTVKPCVEKPPTSSSTKPPTSSSTPSSSSSSAAPAATTTTTKAAVVASAALANTGASIAIPLGIAVLLLAGGGAMLILVRRRHKA